MICDIPYTVIAFAKVYRTEMKEIKTPWAEAERRLDVLIASEWSKIAEATGLTEEEVAAGTTVSNRGRDPTVSTGYGSVSALVTYEAGFDAEGKRLYWRPSRTRTVEWEDA